MDVAEELRTAPVRVAAVAPAAHRGADEWKNADQAVEYAYEAASNGAKLILFPEAYPGPSSGPLITVDGNGGALDRLRTAAQELEVYIAPGCIEPSGRQNSYYLTHKLISPDGNLVLDYQRCQPTPPALNAHLYGGRAHILPGGDPPKVADLGFCRAGITICSELKVPELARIAMLRGAELILNPVGGRVTRRTVAIGAGPEIPLTRAKMNVWSAFVQARASENMTFVVLTANAGGSGSTWGSCIASPEGLIARSEGPGITYGDLDFGWLRALRSRAWRSIDFEEDSDRRPIVSDPGQHRDRRPELYELLVKPDAAAFNHSYILSGTEEWEAYEGTDPGSSQRKKAAQS